MATKSLLILIGLIILAASMPHETRLPAGIEPDQVVFADSTLGKSMQVILTNTQINIYKLDSAGSYQLLQQRTICAPSALSTSQNGVHPSNGNGPAILSVAIGCKDGHFLAYEISEQDGQILRSFSKNIGEPIERVLTGGNKMPYYLIATADHIEVFGRENYRKELEIPVAGPIAEMVFEESKDMVLAADRNSLIQIYISAPNNIQVRRTPRLGGKPETAKVEGRRVLQNGTAVCGNGVIETGQTCDDGNTVSLDGCSSTCQTQYCGDGIINNKGKEACDDGNTVGGDGCSNCVVDCGNGQIDSGQQCDDGNTVSGDGCSSTCLKQNKEPYRAAIAIGVGVGSAAAIGGVAASTLAGSTSSVASAIIGAAPSAAVGAAGGVSASVGTGAVGTGAQLVVPP